MKHLSIQEMKEEISSGGNYVVDFYADWCGPCKAIAPVLEEISSEGNVKVIKIDVDSQEKDSLAEFGIKSIPTLIAFKEGKAVNRLIGSQSKSRLLEMFS